MRITLRVWRQAGPSVAGSLVSYDVPDVSPEMSFLEMLDVLNERLINEGKSLWPSTTIAARGSAAPAA